MQNHKNPRDFAKAFLAFPPYYPGQTPPCPPVRSTELSLLPVERLNDIMLFCNKNTEKKYCHIDSALRWKLKNFNKRRKADYKASFEERLAKRYKDCLSAEICEKSINDVVVWSKLQKT